MERPGSGGNEGGKHECGQPLRQRQRHLEIDRSSRGLGLPDKHANRALALIKDEWVLVLPALYDKPARAH